MNNLNTLYKQKNDNEEKLWKQKILAGRNKEMYFISENRLAIYATKLTKSKNELQSIGVEWNSSGKKAKLDVAKLLKKLDKDIIKSF